MTMELMWICYSISPFCHLLTSIKNFACGGLTFHLHNGESLFLDGAMSCNSVWPYMFRLTTIQAFVATQHSVVTKLSICTPVRKCLDPPLFPVLVNTTWKLPPSYMECTSEDISTLFNHKGHNYILSLSLSVFFLIWSL